MDCTSVYEVFITITDFNPPTSFLEKVGYIDAFRHSTTSSLALRKEENEAKSMLDSFSEDAYYKARDSIFPLAVSGSQGATGFTNRAGHKLKETLDVSGVWDQFIERKQGDECACFVDLCGGPGSFAQALFGSYPHKTAPIPLVGYGITLKDKHRGAPTGWYPDLLKNPGFIITFGVDATGDIYNLSNIFALESIIASQKRCPRLVVADGGFEVSRSEANLQEALSHRIIFSQWHAAMRLLGDGGCLVLKLFDTFSPFTQSLLYLTAFFFEKTLIVKPLHSRAVNSERYLVGVRLKEAKFTEKWRFYLSKVHRSCFFDNEKSDGNNGPLAVEALVEIKMMKDDKMFSKSVEEMIEGIGRNQINALKKILDALNDPKKEAKDKSEVIGKREREEY